MIRRLVLIAGAMLAVSGTADAQLKLPGGLGGAAGGLPGLNGATTGNVAGLLGWCVKNKLLGSAGGGAGGVLSKLTGQPDVQQSPDYKAGLAGMLLGGGQSGTPQSGGVGGMLGGLKGAAGAATGTGGGGFSLSSLSAPLKTKMCDAVLTHARTLL
jgi:hypothetical protein